MRSTVLYRKWRPADFDSVAGQDAVIRTLQNAVAQDKISHAYLFCGPRGTGKTTTARIMARAINGVAPSAPALDGGSDGMGFDLIEIDAASNRGIDDIRELRERANYQPGSSRFKVYLIDEVHQLTGAAADALLKTLEEPPPHVVFILAMTDPEALKPTVLSRCQRFDFRRIAVDDTVARLRTIADAEQILIGDDALRLIAREATGSLRDAVNLLDQLWTTCGDEVSLEAAQEALGLSPDARALELVQAALHKDLSAGLGVIGAVQSDAIDFMRFKKQVVTHLRHVLLLLTGAEGSLALSKPEEERLREVGQGVDPSVAVAALRAFADADVRSDPYQPLPLELALADIVYGPAQVVAEAAPPPAQQRRDTQRGGQRGGQRGEPQRGREQQRGREAQRGRRETRAAQPPPVGRAAAGADPTPAPNRAPAAPQRRVAEASASAAQPAAPARAPTQAGEPIVAIRLEVKKRGNPRLAAMLNRSCRIVEETEQKLTLGFFPNYHAFHLVQVREGADDVAAAASAVLGRTVTIECVEIDDRARRAASPAAQPPVAASGPAAPTQAEREPGPAVEPAAKPAPEPAPEPAPTPSYSLAEDAMQRFGARKVPT